MIKFGKMILQKIALAHSQGHVIVRRHVPRAFGTETVSIATQLSLLTGKQPAVFPLHH